MRDYSREAAHERYEKAAALAANAGSHTQAGLNEVYKQLNQNASWTPEDGWAENYQEGVEAYIPSWLIPNEEAFPSYPTVQAEDTVQEPASMSVDWAGLAKKGEDVKRENRRMANSAYPELQPLYETEFQGRPASTTDDEGFGGSEGSWFNDWTPQPEEVYGDDWLSPREHYYESLRDEYRKNNPMPEGAMEGSGYLSKTSQDYLDRYKELFNNAGGIDESTSSGLSDVMSWLSSNYEGAPSVDELPEGGLIDAFDKLSKETIDDGTLRRGNIESNHMTGKRYKEYVAAGFGGRPIDEIEDDQTYDKLEEMRDYNFIPYVASDDQLASWIATKLPNDITKAFNLFGSTRDRFTDPTMTYNGTTIYLNDLEDAKNKFVNQQAAYDAGYDVEEPKKRFRIYDEKNAASYQDIVANKEDLQYAWVGDLKYAYPDLEEKLADVPDEYFAFWFNGQPGLWTFSSPDKAFKNINLSPVVEFDQVDGSHVGPIALSDLNEAEIAGEIEHDWGPANIGKDSGDRKDFTKMFGSLLSGDPAGFIEDLAPNMADLIMQSAPIMFQPTGWTMSISNALSGLQGLDPRSYDWKDNKYYALAPMADSEQGLNDGINAERYLSNVILGGLVPLTERIAGGIGGTGGVIGRPIKRFLAEKGAPKLSLSLLDAIGEGVEEIVASTWEDAQTYGLSGMMADPVYETDEEGNVVVDAEGNPRPRFDTSGHEMRQMDWPLIDARRVGNFADQALENFLAGLMLGLPLSLFNDGEIDEKYKQPNNIKPLGTDELFEVDENGRVISKITPEDFGTYNTRR